MRTTSSAWAGMASIVLSASLLAGAGISHAAGKVSVPPEFTVGELPLIFDKGLDAKNLPAKVEEIRAKSKALRAEALAKRVIPETVKFGSMEQCMAAMLQNKRLPEGNAYIRAFLTDPARRPYADDSTAWFYYFGPGGKYPDRLEPATLAVLKERMLVFVNACVGSKEIKGHPALPLEWGKLWGTENQDFRARPPVYLAFAALSKDPAYANKKVGDMTVTEWYGIFKTHMIDFLRDRVMTGLWIEPGSGYAHLTYEHLVHLYNLAPDPEIRQVAKMVLDLVFIEEELLSVNGARGGGRSRAGMPLPNKHSGILRMVYGEAMGDLRFSMEFELSDYQVPATAIALHLSKGSVKPYVIYNRLPGELREELYPRDSHLVNYVYRTAGYALGCALLNPNLTYHPSSDQLRINSFLFQSGEWLMPMQRGLPRKEASGRSGKAFWSIQHENVMMLQQFGDSEFVEQMDVVFSGGLNFVEREGWIFVEAKSGYAAVHFIDPAAGAAAGSYKWDTEWKPHWSLPQDLRMAKPTGKYLPLLFHAGYPGQDGSFEQFQKTVLAGKITIDKAKSRIDYQPKNGTVITWFYNQNAKPIELALVNGQPPDLQPALVYDSPYMKAKFGDTTVYVGAGPFRAVYDLKKLTVTESKK